MFFFAFIHYFIISIVKDNIFLRMEFFIKSIVLLMMVCLKGNESLHENLQVYVVMDVLN